ncbi:MAG TPA: nucleoside monophosphate kinase [Acinetobacter johnsonii]|nr:nucleoside monophosphate kinase [Acinetobacter johnsonii]
MNGILTIAGRPGSGKSTASQNIASQLHLPHFSSGDYMRKLGAERGLNILETNHKAEEDDELDQKVDQKLRELGLLGVSRVIDSRMAWHWIPDSLKVYLDLDLLTAAIRIIKDASEERKAKEHIPDDPEEYAEQLRLRHESEARRYMHKYGVNPYDTKNYDMVVDTHEHDIEQTTGLIVARYLLPASEVIIASELPVNS